MRLSEFAEKRIVNLYDGEIMGSIGDSDLIIDPENGMILEILVPVGKGRKSARRTVSVPWTTVKKVGSEVIVVDIEENLFFYK